MPSAYKPPVQIDLAGTLGDQFTTNNNLGGMVEGPWLAGGILYMVLMTEPSSAPGYEAPCDVWTSTDGGQTWTSRDHAHAPLGTVMSCCFDGANTISVCISPQTPTPSTTPVGYSVITFDCLTNTWGILSGASPILNAAINGPLLIIPLLSGSLMVITLDPAGVGRGTITGIIFSLGAWGVPFAVDTNAVAALAGFGNNGPSDAPFFVLDATGNVHLFFAFFDAVSNPVTGFDIHLFYQHIAPSGTLGSFFEFPGVGTVLDQHGTKGIPTIVGSNLVFPVQTIVGAVTGRPGVYIGSPLSAPGWTLFPDIDPTHAGALSSDAFSFTNAASTIGGVVQIVNIWNQGGSAADYSLVRVSSTLDFVTWIFSTVTTFDAITDGPPFFPNQPGFSTPLLTQPLVTAFGLGLTSIDPTQSQFVRWFLATLSLTLSISCGSPPSGNVGTFYSHLFPVTGDVPPDVFTITVGALPTGLSLNSATGLVSGVPAIAGIFPFTITVTDSTAAVASIPCSITISSGPPPPPPPGTAQIKITFRGIKRTKCEPVEPLATLPPVPHVKRAM
jgi:hypothetical protein